MNFNTIYIKKTIEIEFQTKFKIMKTLKIVLIALLIISLANISSEAKNYLQMESSEMIINLTSDAFDDAHSTYMAIHFAEMGLSNDLEVIIFLNVHGVRLLETAAGNLSFRGESLVEKLSSFVDQGGKVIVCPMCMQAYGMDGSNLPANFELGEATSMMNRIKNKPVVFTY
ncbi:MAG: hypothetical protein EA391_12915 [Balneolaceae bacterium]|nr:MAG: hypothetical protein EA391_12915 [Balneolaceae bacterium]